MRLRPNADAAECKAFLDDTLYPCTWDLDTLARHCHLTRIESSCGDVAGFIWFHWIRDADRVLDLHIALHPRFQRRALTASLMADVVLLARSLGARTLLARPISSDHAALLLRLGFSLHGPFAVLPIHPLSHALHPALLRALKRKFHGQDH